MQLTKEDIYGQRHPIESTVSIPDKLEELRKEMDKLSEKDKKVTVGWRQAKIKCPHLMDDDFFLMFLRCEVFKVPLAAVRLAKYWNKRIELMGPEKAFKPIAIDCFHEGDDEAISSGVLKLTGTKDPSGRSILFYDPALHPNYHKGVKYDSVLRLGAYLLHEALQDTTTQQRGLILICCPRNSDLRKFDRNIDRLLISSITGAVPVRLSAIHICHPPSFFKIIWPLIKIFMGKRILKRVRIHFGSKEKVLNSMAECGLTSDILPTDVDGDVVLDNDRVMKEKRRLEDEAASEKAEN